MSFTHKAFHKIRSETAGAAKSIVYAILIAVVIRTFLFEPFWGMTSSRDSGKSSGPIPRSPRSQAAISAVLVGLSLA